MSKVSEGNSRSHTQNVVREPANDSCSAVLDLGLCSPLHPRVSLLPKHANWAFFGTLLLKCSFRIHLENVEKDLPLKRQTSSCCHLALPQPSVWHVFVWCPLSHYHFYGHFVYSPCLSLHSFPYDFAEEEEHSVFCTPP